MKKTSLIVGSIVLLLLFYLTKIIYIDKVSIQSGIIKDVVGLYVSMTDYHNVEKAEKKMRDSLKKFNSDYVFKFKHDVNNDYKEINVSNMDVHILEKISSTKNPYIIYIHGGAYVEEMDFKNVFFADSIVSNVGGKLYMPEYPLAPHNNYKESYEKLIELYKEVLKQTTADNIIIIGDSAGGGHALGLSILLKEKGLPQPKEIILISPWLDISMKNKNITKELDKKDVILNKEWLLVYAYYWSNGEDVNNYLLSPINGDLSDLAPVSIFIGTDDILYPDTLLLKKKLINQKNDHKLFVYDNMFHNFPLYNFSGMEESKDSLGEIIKIVNR